MYDKCEKIIGGAIAMNVLVPQLRSVCELPLVGMLGALSKVFGKKYSKKELFDDIIRVWGVSIFDIELLGWAYVARLYEEWLLDGHTANDLPKSTMHEERELTEKEIIGIKKNRDQLCERAQEFIQGRKDAKGSEKTEFDNLLREMEDEVFESDDDTFRKTYLNLTMCKK